MCQQHLKSLWDNFKRNNIPIKGVPKEEREQEIENLFEKMMENFPSWRKKRQAQEVQRVPNKVNPTRPTPRHVIIKPQRLKTKKES